MGNPSKNLTWLGHNCFYFRYGETKFIIDPFLVEGIAPPRSEKIKADYLLVSHGHADHCANTLDFARSSGATVVGIAEMASFFAEKGVKTEGMNIGGAIYVPATGDPALPKIQILAVSAPHSSTAPDNSPGGASMGFVLSFSQNGAPLSPDQAPIKPLKDVLADAEAFSIYFACDTGYFSEMSWIGKLGIDVAVLPIGDRYTMGPSLSLEAISALNARYVVPCHYNTWPPISQDASKWADAVQRYTQSKPLVLKPGVPVAEDESGNWK